LSKEIVMKLSRITLATSFALLAFAQAHAEEYQGVLEFNSTQSRSEVRAQAIQAARSSTHPDAASSSVAAAPASPRERSGVKAEAVAHAHRPNQNLRVEAFADSRIPAYYYRNAAKPSTAQAASSDSTVVQ
jgi:hypothetical protein